MKSQDEIADEAIGYASHGDEKGNVNPEGYSEKQVGLLHGFIDGYKKCQEDNSEKKYTIENIERYHNIRVMEGNRKANEYIESLNKNTNENA